MSDFDSRQFRDVLGHFPTGVTVVTGIDGRGRPQGITIGSFVSVSLDPPLVGFLPGKNSRSWPAMAESERFCVNILGADQADLCWRFAKEPPEGDDGAVAGKFDGVAWTAAASGAPVLEGVIGWIDCTVESVHDIGDHYFVVGRVTDLGHRAEVSDAMVFFRGKVASVAPQP
ncbi:MAG: flavin reductase family protein [Ilumatobacteraceae bacterium]